MKKELIKAIESDEAVSMVWPNVGLGGYRGSLAHGTQDDETDDIDILGVFISPKPHYFGLTRLDHVDRVCVNDKYDFCLYEIGKFFKLLLNGNPNVLTLLFSPNNMMLSKNWWGKKIIENRDIFISKRLYKSFGGYAFGQLRRMSRCCTTQAFQGAKRRERYEKFGYDCKNASHLIRLLRMGIEVLSTGEITIARHDAQQLLEIKRGGWTLEQVEVEAKRLDVLLTEALIKSQLPAKPDHKKAEELLIEILQKELA